MKTQSKEDFYGSWLYKGNIFEFKKNDSLVLFSTPFKSKDTLNWTIRSDTLLIKKKYIHKIVGFNSDTISFQKGKHVEKIIRYRPKINTKVFGTWLTDKELEMIEFRDDYICKIYTDSSNGESRIDSFDWVFFQKGVFINADGGYIGFDSISKHKIILNNSEIKSLLKLIDVKSSFDTAKINKLLIGHEIKFPTQDALFQTVTFIDNKKARIKPIDIEVNWKTEQYKNNTIIKIIGRELFVIKKIRSNKLKVYSYGYFKQKYDTGKIKLTIVK